VIKRVAALFALFAFAVAWLVGVLCGHAPLTRLENAGIALASGLLAGIGVGIALERIVLVRFAEQWQEHPAPPAANAPAGERAPAAATAPSSAPSRTSAARNAAEAVAAGGEAKR
jgi:branched-subunit amino acid ABC-type transport system permease component